MKNRWLALGIAGMMTVGSLSVYASEVIEATPINAAQKEEGLVSIHQMNYHTPISLAEFMITVVEAAGVELHPIMDTHYAMPAMLKAEEWGIINLEEYPMETWLNQLTEEEFVGMLTKVMQSGKVDMGEVYAAFNNVLVNKVTVDGKEVDLEGKKMTHYMGHVMVPLREVAEAMGFKVTWNPQTYTATLNNGKIESQVQVGFDSYVYTSVNAIGMSAPMSVGAAPRLIEGSMYVPAEYFTLFATSNVSDGALNYTMK